jgi:hypothetical protein
VFDDVRIPFNVRQSGINHVARHATTGRRNAYGHLTRVVSRADCHLSSAGFFVTVSSVIGSSRNGRLHDLSLLLFFTIAVYARHFSLTGAFWKSTSLFFRPVLDGNGLVYTGAFFCYMALLEKSSS